jgi:hypothetical protein
LLTFQRCGAKGKIGCSSWRVGKAKRTQAFDVLASRGHAAFAALPTYIAPEWQKKKGRKPRPFPDFSRQTN